MNPAMKVQATSLYHFEAYGPVDLGDLQLVYRSLSLPWQLHHARLVKGLIRQGRKLLVPVGDVIHLFRTKNQPLPDELDRLLKSNLLWEDGFRNLVVTAGLNDLLDKRFKASAYTSTDYVGLAGATPTFAAGDTMTSHTGWTEVVAYSQSVRQALSLGTVSAGSVNNSGSKAIFSINGTTTVGGSFVVTDSTKSGTTGILYGGGALAEGNRSLVNGDSLAIQVTLTVAAL